jgi:hypothetical protein
MESRNNTTRTELGSLTTSRWGGERKNKIENIGRLIRFFFCCFLFLVQLLMSMLSFTEIISSPGCSGMLSPNICTVRLERWSVHLFIEVAVGTSTDRSHLDCMTRTSQMYPRFPYNWEEWFSRIQLYNLLSRN